MKNSMKNSVVVVGDATGNVIMVSKNNPEYGYIRVEQTRTLVDDNGWARKKSLSTLIPGTVSDLKGFDWSAGEFIEGKIVVRESLTPFNDKDPNRDIKVAGSTGIVCTLEDQPIYRKTFYSDDVKISDEYIKHDNKEEISIAFAAEKTSAVETPVETEEFGAL